jgi:putative hydrolase of the HAD superfamily
MLVPRPEFVYFDLGNVLLYFDHGLAFRSMAKIAKVEPHRMREVIMDTNLQIEYETGWISGEEFIDRIAAALDRSLDSREMLQAAADMFVPNANILPVLDHVRSLGIPAGILSNTCEAHWNWILHMKYPQVVDWFAPVILSYEVQSMKPDVPIYRIATERAGRTPQAIFFTDDRPENIQAAQRYGWNAALFTSSDRLMDLVRNW